MGQCPRIFGVSLGDCANPYFLKYLAAISRGKTIHLTDVYTVYDETIAFLNEFQSPICMDLSLNISFGNENVEFDPELMCHPNPIGDMYDGHPLLLKLDLPKSDIAEMTIHGFINEKNVKRKIAIEVAIDNDEDENKLNGFPMELALANSHLDSLHAKIWNEHMKSSHLEARANRISDATGISSPTRLLQTIQEAYAKEDDLSDLALPERTERGAKRKRKMRKKDKAAGIAVVATIGIITVVAIVPFGSKVGKVLGGVGKGIRLGVTGAQIVGKCAWTCVKCKCCGCDDCAEYCESLCVIL